MPDEAHVCLFPDENDNCQECGKHIDMPDAELPDLGDIFGICKLMESTAKTYTEAVMANTDPLNPELPRLRLIGNTFVRVPHEALLRALLPPSFKQAKKLGYRGTLSRWDELLREAVEQPKPPLFPQT